MGKVYTVRTSPEIGLQQIEIPETIKVPSKKDPKELEDIKVKRLKERKGAIYFKPLAYVELSEDEYDYIKKNEKDFVKELTFVSERKETTEEEERKIREAAEKVKASGQPASAPAPAQDNKQGRRKASK
jgi:hypothetical protein